MNIEEKFVSDLKQDLAQNQVTLPVLPEVAVRVRAAVQDPDSSAVQIAKMVGSDAALSARLLQVTNSALYRGTAPVTSVQAAVARLGMVQVSRLVTSFITQQLYHGGASSQVKGHLTRVWKHSTQVAAISRVLARRFTSLDPDQAMLGGLLHDIGCLPVITRLANVPVLFAHEAALQRIVTDLHTTVGRTVLEAWEFPPELVAVTAEHEDLDRNPYPETDYVDLVLVANLQSYVGTDHPHGGHLLDEVPAFKKLGMAPVDFIHALEEAREEVDEVRRLLEA